MPIQDAKGSQFNQTRGDCMVQYLFSTKHHLVFCTVRFNLACLALFLWNENHDGGVDHKTDLNLSCIIIHKLFIE